MLLHSIMILFKIASIADSISVCGDLSVREKTLTGIAGFWGAIAVFVSKSEIVMKHQLMLP